MRLKPCPCCGNKNLYMGHLCATSLGVVCWAHGGGCGLSMRVEFPDKLKKPRTLKQVEHGCLRKAVKLWNRRKS